MVFVLLGFWLLTNSLLLSLVLRFDAADKEEDFDAAVKKVKDSEKKEEKSK